MCGLRRTWKNIRRFWTLPRRATCWGWWRTTWSAFRAGHDVALGDPVCGINAAFDDQPNNPHDSQLYHIDYYSLPNVYVLVHLGRYDGGTRSMTFLPRTVSMNAKDRLGYWGRERGYRMSDEEVYSVATGARPSVCGEAGCGSVH
jgi:hypothetical protein